VELDPYPPISNKNNDKNINTRIEIRKED
jgi:hypothetical protein